MSRFEDTSTDCAICLEPLYPNGGAQNSEDEALAVLTLSCGHKWHKHCLVQQLQTAQPNSAERLLFTGCQCAKCGQICDHPELESLSRRTDILREKVTKLVQEQLKLDAHEIWKELQEIENPEKHQQARDKVIKEGLRKYAFYLCAHCKEPYFGGTVDCADQVNDSTQQQTQRLCVACTPKSQVLCRNPLEHRGHLVWKCRYCCRPATHLCYGTVHFCDECHDRNSQRVRQMQQNRVLQGQVESAVPPKLTGIPCVGEECQYPKPLLQGHEATAARSYAEFHINGPTFDAEQVYGCAFCSNIQSTTRAPGSMNLLCNPSGANSFFGWRHLSRMKWAVELSELPATETTTTNFVSSFQTCAMEQTVDLRAVLKDHAWQRQEYRVVNEISPLRLEVSAKYMGRTDCPSVFCLKAILLGEDRQNILQQWATPVLDAPPDAWDLARLELEGIPFDRNAHFLSIVVLGQDKRFWQGLYGSKVADISLRILGLPDHIDDWLRQDYVVPAYPPLQQRAIPTQNPESGRGQSGAHNSSELNPRNQTRRLLLEGVLPIFCFFILAWLVKES